MTQLNETWSQGSEPGDPPISSIVVPIPADVIERREALERIRAFCRSSRPDGAKNGTLQLLWDLAKTVLDE